MKRNVKIALVVAGLSIVAVGIIYANPTITEKSAAGNGGVGFAATNTANGLEGGHNDGEDQTYAWIAGDGGPDHPRFYADVETPTQGVSTDADTWALDGNFIEATDSAPSATREWHVRTTWLVRGHVKLENYWMPDPDDGSGYSMILAFATEVDDVTNNWSALSAYDPKGLSLQNEAQFVQPIDARVDVDEQKSNLGLVKFSYDVDMTAVAEITRADMRVQCRSIVKGPVDPAAPNNSGTIKLMDTVTGDPIIVETPYY